MRIFNKTFHTILGDNTTLMNAAGTVRTKKEQLGQGDPGLGINIFVALKHSRLTSTSLGAVTMRQSINSPNEKCQKREKNEF